MVAMGEGQKEDRKGGGLRENDKTSSESLIRALQGFAVSFLHLFYKPESAFVKN